MAISNAIGSNVFDILVCLGVPWLFKTMNGDYITVKSKGLAYFIVNLKKWHYISQKPLFRNGRNTLKKLTSPYLDLS